MQQRHPTGEAARAPQQPRLDALTGRVAQQRHLFEAALGLAEKHAVKRRGREEAAAGVPGHGGYGRQALLRMRGRRRRGVLKEGCAKGGFRGKTQQRR